MEGFHIVDYVVCAGMVIASGLMGLGYSVWRKKSDSQDAVAINLLGGRQMSLLPVASSLIMSLYSGLGMQAIPSEVYLNGSGTLYSLSGCFINGLINNYITLPVFYNLRLSSVHEYLHLRFDKRVRLLVSFLKLFDLITKNTMTIYGAAIFFGQVTGVQVHITTASVCILCAIYTIWGGFRAVIWADTAQAAVMLAGSVTLIVMGAINAGGPQSVWQRNLGSGRLDVPSFDINFEERYTMWSVSIGVSLDYITAASFGQEVVQRYLSLPTLRKAELATWIYIFGFRICGVLCVFIGLVLYATYHDCDPLATGEIKKPDELLAFLVMRTLGPYPGLPGLFAAAMFSLCLSTFSTGLNTAALIVLEDFVKHVHRDVSSKTAGKIIGMTVAVSAAVSFGLVFLVEQARLIFPLAISVASISRGPTAAVFLGGMLLPWMNKQGALYGGVFGFCVTAVVVLGAQFSNFKTQLFIKTVKQATTDGCPAFFNISSTAAVPPQIADNSSVFPLFKISHTWIGAFGIIVTVVAAVIISFSTGMTKLETLNPKLVAPAIRKILPEKNDEEELQPMKPAI